MKKRNNGISLLVLIITIIVMVILASAIILSITGNNPISRANETKVKTDLTALKDEYNNFYSSALFDNVSNTKGYYTDKMNITKEGNIIYKGKVVNEGENNSLASIMPSIVGTEYEGKVFVADGKIYIDNRDNFLSEEQQEWAKEVGINVLNEGEVLVLSTEEVSLKISQKERIYATVMPDTDSQVEFDIDEPTKARQLTSETNTVDIQGISDGVAILTAKVTAKDGTEIEKKVTIKVNVGDYIKVEKITIDPNVVELGLDDEQQLKAIITPETADNQDVTWEVKSQNPQDVVELTETGEVTGRNVGTAKIIAKGEYGNLTSEVCSVSVVDRTTITLDKTTLQLRKGEKGKITANVKNENKRTDTVKWETSDNTKVEVDKDGNITAKEVGSATITAKYLTKSESCVVTVEEPLNLSAKVTQARGTIVTLKIDADTTYSTIEKIQVKYKEEGTEEWQTQEIKVDDTKYNNEAYKIEGLTAEKTYNIEVIAHLKEGGQDKKVVLKAKPEKILVTSVHVSQKTLKIYYGDNTHTLQATVNPEDATNKKVRWESSKQDIATIDQNGKITPVEVGQTTITAISEDDETKIDTCEIEILEPITFEANVVEGSITSDTIPLNIHAKTEYGNITEIKVKYKEKTGTDWTEKTITDVVNKTEYTNGNYQITELKPYTEYNIEVSLKISSGRSKTITIEVTQTDKIDVSNLTIEPTSIDIPLGNTKDLTAKITPQDATFQGLTWISEPSNIAIVEGDKTATKGVAKATITAKGLGTTNIKVTSEDDNTKQATCSVEVTEPIKITASVDTSGITDEVIPVKIETSTVHGTISKIEVQYQAKGTSTWTIGQVENLESNKTSYNNTYNITGLKPNTEYIIQVKVTITSDVIEEHSKSIESLPGKTLKRDVKSLTLDNNILEIPLGDDTKTLIATITPSDATNQGLTWVASDATGIIDIDGEGTATNGKAKAKIKTKNIGTTNVTVTSEDNPSERDTCTIKVIEPITINANVEENSITSSSIPVKVTAETKHGNISKICVRYRVKGNSNSWQEQNVTLNSASYNDTITLNGLSADTEYEIEVTVTILSPGDAADGRTKTSDTINIKTPKVLVNSVTLNKKELQIPLGNTEQLTATVQPTNATHKELTWQSSDTSVANVDQSGNITTDVVNGKIGNTTITVLSQDDPNKTATCTVTTVEPISLNASVVEGSITSDTIPVNIDVSTQYGKITKIEVKHRVNSSSNQWTTNTVNNIGTSNSYKGTYNITGLTPNTKYNIEVTVTITDNRTMTKNNLSGTTKKIDVTKITLDPSSKEIVYGNESEFTITAKIEPSNATNQGVTWSSDKTGVATVDQTGKITIKGVGTATITATSQDDPNKTATCTVTVQDPVAQIGTKKYATLQKAFDDVNGSSGSYTNVEVLKNITNQTATLENNKYAKLSLGAHTITNTSTTATITNKGNMQIEGSGSISNTSGNAIDNMSTLTINTSGTITGSKDGINNTKTLNVNKGTIKSTGSDSNSCNGINNSSTGANLNISGGTVEGYNGVRVYGILNMTGGVINSTIDDAIEFASGTVNITGGSVTGEYGIWPSSDGTASSKILTIGNDDNNVSTSIPEIKVSNTAVNNGSSNFIANFYDGSVTGNPQFYDESEANIPFRYIITKSSNTETLTAGEEQVNAPKLVDSMSEITFDSNGNIIPANLPGSDWYAYTSQGEYQHDEKTSKWANAMTEDRSQWVWIPRYAYKIKTPYTSEASDINVIFLNGDTDQYKDKNGNLHDVPKDYIVHPAFTDESGEDYKNGGWNKELTGIWVAKYEASKGTGIENLSGKEYPKFVPNADSYTSITIGDMFTLCKNLVTSNDNPYNFYSDTTDTHLMKNSEWGAVAYLAQSKYGRNGVEVTQNKYNGSSAKTGYGASSSAKYNTPEGQLASTTGNMYGIYDMSGGAYEYIAGYLNSGSSSLKEYGQTLLDETNNKNGEENKGTSTKYVSVYENSTDEYNDATNKARKGEAIWETSTSGYGYTSWFGKYMYFINGPCVFPLRGGMYNSRDNIAGLFCFYATPYNSYPEYGSFRAVCVSK